LGSTASSQQQQQEAEAEAAIAKANKEIDSLKATINKLTAFIYVLTNEMESDAFDDLVRSINRHARARMIKQRRKTHQH
jgi:cell division protein FtsB